MISLVRHYRKHKQTQSCCHLAWRLGGVHLHGAQKASMSEAHTLWQLDIQL